MTCYDIQQWVTDLEIPVETQIEFKYFVSAEDNSTFLFYSVSPIYWLGNEADDNLKLFITKQDAKQIEHERKTRDLKTMSFNIRNDKESDKNEFAWEVRKYNVRFSLLSASRPSDNTFPRSSGFRNAQRAREATYKRAYSRTTSTSDSATFNSSTSKRASFTTSSASS
jgi:hypothetical protein